MDFCKYNFSLMFGLCCKLHFLMIFSADSEYVLTFYIRIKAYVWVMLQVTFSNVIFSADSEYVLTTTENEIPTHFSWRFLFPPTSNINTLANREKTSEKRYRSIANICKLKK